MYIYVYIYITEKKKTCMHVLCMYIQYIYIYIYIYIVGYNGIIKQNYAMMYNLKLAISIRYDGGNPPVKAACFCWPVLLDEI